MERELERVNDALEMATVGANNAVLLRAELTAEQQARRGAEERLAAVHEQLAQVGG